MAIIENIKVSTNPNTIARLNVHHQQLFNPFIHFTFHTVNNNILNNASKTRNI